MRAGSSTYWVLKVAVPRIRGGRGEEMGGRVGAVEPTEPIVMVVDVGVIE